MTFGWRKRDWSGEVQSFKIETYFHSSIDAFETQARLLPVKLRTKGALSQKTAKLMVFTLIQAASKKCLRLKGRNQLPKVIEGIKFNDGVEVTDDAENRAA